APLRKLSRKERFIGPASQLAESGDKVDALLGAIEQAFGFVDVEGDEESAELSKILKTTGAKDVVTKVCGLEESHPLFNKIVPIVEKTFIRISFTSVAPVVKLTEMNNRQSIQSPEPDPAAMARQEEQNMEEEEEIFEGLTLPAKMIRSCFSSGIGLGPDMRDFMSKRKWPLDTEEQALRYHGFVQTVVNRIRAGESNFAETEYFIGMFSQLDDWMYLLPTLQMLPELAQHGPRCNNNEMLNLVKHVQHMERVKERDRLKRIADRHSMQPTQRKTTQTTETVMADARQKVARLLFGLRWEGNATSAMKRLVTSWVQVGYPDEVIEQSITKKSKAGRTLSQDSLGLPRGHGDTAQPKPNRRRHATHAHPTLAPVTVQANRMPRGAMTKGQPRPSAPTFRRSLTAPADPRTNQGLPSKHKDNPGYSSVDIDDTPPASSSGYAVIKETHHSTDGATEAPSARTHNTSYRDFERTVFLDCHTYTYGATEKFLFGRQTRKYPNRNGTTVTLEGMIVVRGFDKPAAAKSDRMLKMIDNRAKAANEFAHDFGEEERDVDPAPSSQRATRSHDYESEVNRMGWSAAAAAPRERKVSFAPVVDEDDEALVSSSSSVDTVMKRGILIPRISLNNSHTNPIPHHRDSSSPPASLTGEATVDEEELREFLGKGEMPKTASLEAVEEKVDSKIQASDEILNVHGPSVRVESPEEEERRR
ncbi:MAG: hypothetical protein Q9174_006391, partial [Haloplaca sp. 1 TL-2023]